MNEKSKQEIIELYKSGLSANKVGKKLGWSKSYILKVIKEEGITRHEYIRKYTLNENYFDIIDTEEKAYWLGFLYADGCNDVPNGRIILPLQEEDKEILDKFNLAINSNRPIAFVDCSKRTDKKCKNMYRLVINSKYMSNALIKLGCMQRKTFLLEFPTEDQVPKHLLKHWLRGLWDGDGSFSLSYKNNKIRMNTSIISTDVVINKIENFISTELNIKGHIYQPKIYTKNTTVLHYSGLIRGLKIIRWLYVDSKINLKRKYDRYINIEQKIKIQSETYGSKIKNKFTPI